MKDSTRSSPACTKSDSSVRIWMEHGRTVLGLVRPLRVGLLRIRLHHVELDDSRVREARYRWLVTFISLGASPGLELTGFPDDGAFRADCYEAAANQNMR